MKSNRNYVTENINLKQQVIALKVANKDKYETIKSMKQELLEYNQLRNRFKVLYEENEKLKKVIDVLKNRFFIKVKKHINSNDDSGYLDYADSCFVDNNLTPYEYDLLKEVFDNDK